MARKQSTILKVIAKKAKAMFGEQSVDVDSAAEHLSIKGVSIPVDTLRRYVRMKPEETDAIIERYLREMVKSPRPESTTLADVKSRIFPRIAGPDIWERVDQYQAAHREFVNECFVLYFVDSPESLVSITEAERARWRISIDDLDDLARENLGRRSVAFHEVDAKEDGGRAIIFANHDGYDASRLLLNGLHEQFAARLGADFIAWLPSRDLIMLATQEPAGFVRRMQTKMTREFGRLPYPISRERFIVTRDGIAGVI